MSLNRAQIARTADDFQRNLAVSGWSVDELADWLGMTSQQTAGVIAMDGSGSPVDTWLVRDALDKIVAAGGGSPLAWSVLTEASREKAVHWFTLRRVPPLPER